MPFVKYACCRNLFKILSQLYSRTVNIVESALKVIDVPVVKDFSGCSASGLATRFIFPTSFIL